MCPPEEDGKLLILDTHKPTGNKESLGAKGLLDALGFPQDAFCGAQCSRQRDSIPHKVANGGTSCRDQLGKTARMGSCQVDLTKAGGFKPNEWISSANACKLLLPELQLLRMVHCPSLNLDGPFSP